MLIAYAHFFPCFKIYPRKKGNEENFIKLTVQGVRRGPSFRENMIYGFYVLAASQRMK